MSDGFTVNVLNDKLNQAMNRMVEKMPGIADILARKIAFDVLNVVVRTVPVDTGRYRAGWRVALSSLESGGAEDEHVNVFEEDGMVGVVVTNPVEYGPVIEFGTAARPPGNHLATALEMTRRRLLYGRGDNSLTAEVQDAWREASS